MQEAKTDSIVCNIPSNIESLIGQRFSKLTVAGFVEMKGSRSIWRCSCDCGGEVNCRGNNLKTGGSTNCGCVRRAKTVTRNTIHGMAKRKDRHTSYGCWAAMKTRCLNPLATGTHNYRGRGIKMCERWLSFESFYADMGPRPSLKHSIDRINQNGDYCPENCRWADRVTQNNNRRDNILVFWQNRKWTITELAAHAGMSRKLLSQRIRLKWEVDRAITQPSNYFKTKNL